MRQRHVAGEKLFADYSGVRMVCKGSKSLRQIELGFARWQHHLIQRNAPAFKHRFTAKPRPPFNAILPASGTASAHPMPVKVCKQSRLKQRPFG